MGFSKGLKNEFETAVVNEPSVFEPLKFYCNSTYEIVHVHIMMFMPFPLGNFGVNKGEDFPEPNSRRGSAG